MEEIVDVKTEYAKDKNLKKDHVKELLKWVSTQPHLPKINELQAIAFLKKNHYFIEPAKKTIDTFFTLKKLWPDLFLGRNLTVPPVQGILDVILYTILPKTTPEGCSLIFIKVLSSDIVNYELSQCLKYLDMVIMSHLYKHGTSKGYLCVLDVKNMPYAFLAKMDWTVLKKYFYYLQEVIPLTLISFHFIAKCFFMEELISTVTSGMPKAILPSIHVHNSVEEVEKHIPIDLLPSDYGGSVEPVKVLKEKQDKQLLKDAPIFEWEDQQVVDEDKRLEKPNDAITPKPSIPRGVSLFPKFVDVQTEYAKDKNLKVEDVKKILNLVNSQPHLPKINEIQAIAFLKKNLYHIEPTTKNINAYFHLKNLWHDLFLGRNLSTDPSFKKILDSIVYIPLPKKSPEGYTIILMKILSSDIINFDLSQCFKYLDMTIMSHLYQHGTSEGHVLILDVKNLPHEYLSKLDYTILKRYFYFVQEVKPIFLKGLHYITSCSFMEKLLDDLRSSLPKQALPFVYVHASLEDLEKFIPRALLPVDYGGSEESLDVLKKKWEKEFLANTPLFQWEGQQIIDADENKSISATEGFEVENILTP